MVNDVTQLIRCDVCWNIAETDNPEQHSDVNGTWLKVDTIDICANCCRLFRRCGELGVNPGKIDISNDGKPFVVTSVLVSGEL